MMAAEKSLFVLLEEVLTVPTNASGSAKKASVGVGGEVATVTGEPVAVGTDVLVGLLIGVLDAVGAAVVVPVTALVAVGTGVSDGEAVPVAVGVGAAAPKEKKRELPGGTDLMRLKVSPLVRRKRNSMFWAEVVGLLTERPVTTPTRLS